MASSRFFFAHVISNIPTTWFIKRDHALSNNWQDHRDCHVKPDLVLIYRKPDMKTLQLVRLGSHNELRRIREEKVYVILLFINHLRTNLNLYEQLQNV